MAHASGFIAIAKAKSSASKTRGPLSSKSWRHSNLSAREVSKTFTTKMIEELAKVEKISDIQKKLLDTSSLLVAYPDASEDKSKEWLTTINCCRLELRRRFLTKRNRVREPL